MTTTYYADKIVQLFAKMSAIRPSILSANQGAVQDYLQTVWKSVCTITSSFVRTYQPDSLQQRFASYVEAEECRLRDGLKTVRYDIDAMDTLSLITGPGRIEKVSHQRECQMSDLSCDFLVAVPHAAVVPPA